MPLMCRQDPLVHAFIEAATAIRAGVYLQICASRSVISNEVHGGTCDIDASSSVRPATPDPPSSTPVAMPAGRFAEKNSTI
jgi:hypothetical protein